MIEDGTYPATHDGELFCLFPWEGCEFGVCGHKAGGRNQLHIHIEAMHEKDKKNRPVDKGGNMSGSRLNAANRKCILSLNSLRIY